MRAYHTGLYLAYPLGFYSACPKKAVVSQKQCMLSAALEGTLNTGADQVRGRAEVFTKSTERAQCYIYFWEVT